MHAAFIIDIIDIFDDIVMDLVTLDSANSRYSSSPDPGKCITYSGSDLSFR